MSIEQLGWALVILDSIMVYILAFLEMVENAPVAPDNDEGNLP